MARLVNKVSRIESEEEDELEDDEEADIDEVDEIGDEEDDVSSIPVRPARGRPGATSSSLSDVDAKKSDPEEDMIIVEKQQDSSDDEDEDDDEELDEEDEEEEDEEEDEEEVEEEDELLEEEDEELEYEEDKDGTGNISSASSTTSSSASGRKAPSTTSTGAPFSESGTINGSTSKAGSSKGGPVKIKLMLGNRAVGSSSGSGAGTSNRTSRSRRKLKDPGSSDSSADELGQSRTKDFSKMTARQRAAQGKEFYEPLLVLEEGSKALQLTAAEKEAKKAETARRRKNQSEKKLEDDKIETVNRLLKAQSSRSRGKASAVLLSTSASGPANPNPADGTNSSDQHASGIHTPAPPLPTAFRTIQSIKSGAYEITLSAPLNPAFMAKLAKPIDRENKRKQGPKPVCSVEDCGKERKYRCVGGEDAFELGGCGLDHLRTVQRTRIETGIL
ncbi:INO80 complex subunit B-like conserved region [Phaffia rhodozyma]|uniref:INO80 complex subunit B-like conserved region n=1 Tax=Phaffia rhodozyma TaxID=264483 RepID=A0A0F7SLX6_PHARH|nr:INO80 complex subunit B-like conserved region [Phaffia rhodozyma]